MAEHSDETAREGQESSSPPRADAHGGAGETNTPAGAGSIEPGMTRGRRIWVRVILVLATILAVLAIFAIWANRQLMNPDNWAKTSTALLQKQTVRSAVAGYLVDQLYANVTSEGELKSGSLPAAAARRPDPGGLHNLAEQGAERALGIPRVQDAWMRPTALPTRRSSRSSRGATPGSTSTAAPSR